MSKVAFYQGTSRVIRAGLGALLLWASIWKIVAPGEFLASIQDYALAGPAVAGAAAVILPWVELVVAVCLLAGRFKLGAMLLCVVMFLVFGLAQASVLYRGLAIDCGCGLMPGHSRITPLTMLRSAGLAAAAAVGYAAVWRAEAATPLPRQQRVAELTAS